MIKVKNHKSALINSGYWFIAPYSELLQQPFGKFFVPAHTRPHIYADDGVCVMAQMHSGKDLHSS